MPISLQTEVRMVKGVGPNRADLLAKRGIHTLEDLLNYLPFRYEDRIHFSRIKDVQPGGTYTLRARVMSGQAVRGMYGRDAIYHLLVQDDSGSLPCKFFHGGYLEDRLKPGQQLILHGKVEIDKLRPARREMVNPQIEVLSSEEVDSTEMGRIVPIYEAVGTFGSRMIRRAIYNTLQNLDSNIPDVLPVALREKLHYPSRREALIQTHFPPAEESLDALNLFRSPAQQRLIFEEFFLYQLSMALGRKAQRKENAIAFRVREDKVREALKRILPFKPTAAQKRVLAEIAADLEKPVPMNRLLQGDVGSGKTIVAMQAAVIAMENGCQAALMAPTEILAVQHFLSARRILAPGGYTAELLISGLKPAEKAAAGERIRTGEARLVIGTHALIEDAVEFGRLGFVAIDEQHRFGVLQRKRLMDKAAKTGFAPHVLVLTATPIPRTLSLTLYGDLDVSVLDELPPGRTPIETRMTTEKRIRPPGLYRLSGDRRIEVGTKSGDGRVRTAFTGCFSKVESGAAPRADVQRRKRRRDAAIPAERSPDSGGDHGDRGRRGRAECHGDGHRARGTVRAGPTAPASRPHRPRRPEITLHPGGPGAHDRRRPRAPGNDGAHHERIRNCRNRFVDSRAGRILRYAAIRGTRLSCGESVARPRTAGASEKRGVSAG